MGTVVFPGCIMLCQRLHFSLLSIYPYQHNILHTIPRKKGIVIIGVIMIAVERHWDCPQYLAVFVCKSKIWIALLYLCLLADLLLIGGNRAVMSRTSVVKKDPNPRPGRKRAYYTGCGQYLLPRPYRRKRPVPFNQASGPLRSVIMA